MRRTCTTELIYFSWTTKIVKPAAARGAFSSMLHESNLGQFGMKLLAEYIWWPHIYRKMYHDGKSYKQCSQAGKNLKVLLTGAYEQTTGTAIR